MDITQVSGTWGLGSIPGGGIPPQSILFPSLPKQSTKLLRLQVFFFSKALPVLFGSSMFSDVALGKAWGNEEIWASSPPLK